MSAADIAVALKLGDAKREGRGWRCRCPLHQGRSLTLRDGDGGRLLVWCFGGCDSRDVLAELRRRGLLDGRTTGYRRPSPQTAQREDVARTARALAIWHQARPAGVSNEIVGGSFTAIEMARPEITGRKVEETTTVESKKKGKGKSTRKRHPLPPRRQGDAYTIPEFCAAKIITPEANAEWQAAREREAASASIA